MPPSTLVPTNAQNRVAFRLPALGTILVISLAGGLLRSAGVADLDITHYDEGVYALQAQGIEWPAQELFSPPLYPALLRLLATLWPWWDTPLFLVNVLLGSVGIVLMALATDDDTRLACMLAAVGIACSGWHVTFSRSVLTDVLYVDWAILGLVATSRASNAFLSGASVRSVLGWLVVLGVAESCALFTKYSAPTLILALVVASAGYCLLRTGNYARTFLWAAIISVISLLALLSFLPWVMQAAGRVGTETFFSHHRGYLMGWRAWPQNAAEYSRYARHLSPELSALGIGAMALLCLLQRQWPATLILGVLLPAVFFLGEIVLVPVALLTCLLGIVRQRQVSFAPLGLAVLLGVLVLLTPLYRPYPRLGLPIIAFSYLAIAHLPRSVSTARLSREFSLRVLALVAVVLGTAGILKVAVADGPRLPSAEVPPLETAARAVAAEVPPERTIHAFVRPCSLFYLVQHADVSLVGGSAPVEAILATGEPLVIDTALVADNLAVLETLRRMSPRPTGQWKYRPSVYTWLNDWHNIPRVYGEGWPYRLLLYGRDATTQ